MCLLRDALTPTWDYKSTRPGEKDNPAARVPFLKAYYCQAASENLVKSFEGSQIRYIQKIHLNDSLSPAYKKPNNF